MRVILRALTQPLQWVRKLRDAVVMIHRIEERLGHLEEILKQQQRILELQVESKTDLGELHRSCLLAAIHTIESQRALEKVSQNRQQPIVEPRSTSVRSAS